MDKGKYKIIKLENEIEILLISNDRANMAYAAVSVGVGSLSDPISVPGISHFCEHMVLLGSKKYPQDYAFNKLIDENNGWFNAYTDDDETNY